jgi:hypothetical protein
LQALEACVSQHDARAVRALVFGGLEVGKAPRP